MPCGELCSGQRGGAVGRYNRGPDVDQEATWAAGGGRGPAAAGGVRWGVMSPPEAGVPRRL